MSLETLTYSALAARLDISVEAARSLAKRLRLPRVLSSDGKAVVTVDVDKIGQSRRFSSAGKTEIESLRADIARLESTAAMHRADFERERDRADRLAAELVKLTAEAMSAKEATARLEGELTALRVRSQEQPPSRLRRLTASVVEADRRARG
jgi:chromosome segregation ATPase